MNTVDMMLQMAELEDECRQLRNLTCDGSMLKGHVVNEQKAQENQKEICAKLARIGTLLQRARGYYEE